MTNKDYSYLEEELKVFISTVYDMRYHPRIVGEKRINSIREMTSRLSDDEIDYLKSKTREFFQKLKEDHEKNVKKSQARK